MTHVAFESKLRSFVRSSMHSYPGTWVALGYVVAYFARTAHAFSAGTKCRNCNVVIWCEEENITKKTWNGDENLANQASTIWW